MSKNALDDAVQLCGKLHHKVEESAPRIDYVPLLDAFELVVDAHTAATLDRVGVLLGKKVEEHMVEPWTWSRAVRGWKASAAEFAATKPIIDRATRELGRFFEEFDVLLTPTVGTSPPLLGVHSTDIPYDKLWQIHFDFIPYTWIHNVAGTPAMSVPLYWNRGLPIGVQFAAGYAKESILFRLAAQLERERPWSKRLPNLIVPDQDNRG